MPLDGLTLKVLVDELDSSLKNGRLIKIFQPEPDTLTLHLRQPGRTEILLLSANPANPRIHTVKEQPANPFNPPSFCMLLRKHLEPSRLLSVRQKGWDRIIHLTFECPNLRGTVALKTLIFEVMGRHSNIFLVDEEGVLLDALKRYRQKDIVPGGKYEAPSDQGKRRPTDITEAEFIDEVRLLPPNISCWRWLQNTFQGFSRTAAREVCQRAGFAPCVKRSELKAADWPKLYEGFAALLSELNAGGIPSWHSEPAEDFTAYALTGRTESRLYPNVNSLVAEFLGGKADRAACSQLAARLRRSLTRHYRRSKKTAKLQQQALAEFQGADELRRQGELLTANFHLLKRGVSFVELQDYLDPAGNLVRIELDPRLSPSANVQKIFKRYEKAKSGAKITRRRLAGTRRELQYLKGVLHQIEEADELAILHEIEEELKSQGYLAGKKTAKARRQEVKTGPERYLSHDNLPILVGRNNRQNDDLTFRQARPNHLWFHAQKIPGSHVLVLAEDVSQETILEAAALAAYFSQAKNSTKVPVDYTLRKHVRKPKGAKPGFVIYDNFQTVIVDPTSAKLPRKKRTG
ncbi:MAG TPA: fibronectin/fibrinogen-binding protein [Firmicutes bacterium]|nr:fibronectin/fibrinogen-binding protein [Bacillota bacterium]